MKGARRTGKPRRERVLAGRAMRRNSTPSCVPGRVAFHTVTPAACNRKHANTRARVQHRNAKQESSFGPTHERSARDREALAESSLKHRGREVFLAFGRLPTTAGDWEREGRRRTSVW